RSEGLIVSDALLDVRFSNHPLVNADPNIRFFAGFPVHAATGEAVGVIGVFDRIPRELGREQYEALRLLARQCESALELRRKALAPPKLKVESSPNERFLESALNAQRAFLDSANVGIITTDKSGVIVNFNRAAQRMLGYSEDEVAGKYTPELFHDPGEIAVRSNQLTNDSAQTPSYLAIAAETRTGIPDERDWTYIRNDGGRVPVRVSITPLLGPEGGLSGYLKIVTDNTAVKEAENRLRHSERFTRSVLDALSKHFYVLDDAGCVIAENKPWMKYESLPGRSGKMLEVGQNFLEFLEKNGAKDKGGRALADGIRAVMDGWRSDFSLEYTFHSGSAQYWFTVKAIPFPDQELGRVILVYENISEHKQMEQRFQLAVESMPNALVMINSSGTIVMVNAQTEAFFGYSRAELIGQTVEMLVPERFRSDHGGFRKDYMSAPISRPMGAGRELYGVRRDGTEFPVEIGLNPIDNHDELLVLGTIVDITERKRLERRFRQAVELAPNAIVMVNETGTIMMVNLQTEMSFGYSRHELLGQPVEMLLPERFRGGHVDFRRGYFDAPKSRPMGLGRDLFALRKDGSEFPVEIGLGVIDDDQGVIVLSSIVDITERKNASDKLKQALNEKEVLLKEVYHRVKNNLQVVSSLINLQARNVTDEATVDLLKQSADRIKAMALLHEKLYQSKDLARIDFNVYIRSLVDHLRYGYDDHSGRIKINLSIDPVELDVDTAIPCGLIINELLSNALKHAFPEDRQGEIGIDFRQESGEFVLSISDNGIGIPNGPDMQKSASLGLQLVATLANQLMGSLALDRSGGTRFNIRFSDLS
ncbi:MAG: PAS domain S-box protein, partial [Gammaproteobacteria bacterium]